MKTMERKKPRQRRSFTPEFKAEIVELGRRGERSIGQVARDFDLTETNVRTWVKQAAIDQGERPGLTTEEREELTKRRRDPQASDSFLRVYVTLEPRPAGWLVSSLPSQRLWPVVVLPPVGRATGPSGVT